MRVIKNIKRRELLVGLLGIPAAQFGLSASSPSTKSQKAETCYNLDLIDECVTCAEEGLFMARAIGSQRYVDRIQNLCTALSHSRWKNEPYVARLGALLTY